MRSTEQISHLAAGLDSDFDGFAAGIQPSLIADLNQDGVVSAFDAYLAHSEI
jgi:hypothetical protein